MVCKKLATDATLNEVLCVRSGCRPVKTYTEGLAYKGPSCVVVPAETSVDLSQELLPLLLRDISSKDFSGAFLIELSVVNLEGL